MLILYSALLKLKGLLLDAATDVRGLSKNHQWKSETWWWNEQVDEATREKHARFKAYSAMEKGGMTAGGQGGKNCLHCPQAYGKACRLACKV